MLQFDKHGYLMPYDVIETDLVTFEQCFAMNKVRKQLLAQYLSFIKDLKEVTPSGFFQWIDGSFVTKKPLPFDIDLVTFVDYKTYELNKSKFESIKKRYSKLDIYFEVFFDKEHKHFYKNELIRLYWKSLYQNNRSIHPKGFIQINF